VPVTYQESSLNESGTDFPIHDLNLKRVCVSYSVRFQPHFMYASKVQSPRGGPVSVLGRPKLRGELLATQERKPRSRSSTRGQEIGAKEVQDRMKYTVDFMNKGLKPNTRGQFIQDSLAILEELLIELPESTKFDIEISMFWKIPRS
jgi:glycerophosphodiester phosphodiesterase